MIIDFGILGIVLIGFVLAFRIGVKEVSSQKNYKIGMFLLLSGAFFLFWGNGAVGLIGSSNNDINMLYNLMLVVAILSSGIAKLKPRGMFWVAIGMLISQIAIFAFYLILGGSWSTVSFNLTFIFSIVWGSSAYLFWRSSNQS